MDYKKFFIGFFCGTSLILAFFLWLLCWYIPRSESWLKEVLWCKRDIALHTNSPKIIILGGSNAFFGMDSAELEKECGFPVVNMAFHAGFSTRIYRYLLDGILQEGDIVVMPLELEHYVRSSTPPNQLKASLGWGKEFFPQEESLIEILAYYSFSLIWDFSFVKEVLIDIRESPKRERINRETALRQFYENIELSKAKGKNKNEPLMLYSFMNMNKHGDIIETVNQPVKFPHKLPTTTTPTSSFIRDFNELNEFVTSKNARIVLVWPVLYEGDDIQKMLELRKKCQNLGITIYGDPKDFMFPADDFSNTYYHLKSSAAKKRTRILANCLLKFHLLPRRSDGRSGE